MPWVARLQDQVFLGGLGIALGTQHRFFGTLGNFLGTSRMPWKILAAPVMGGLRGCAPAARRRPVSLCISGPRAGIVAVLSDSLQTRAGLHAVLCGFMRVSMVPSDFRDVARDAAKMVVGMCARVRGALIHTLGHTDPKCVSGGPEQKNGACSPAASEITRGWYGILHPSQGARRFLRIWGS